MADKNLLITVSLLSACLSVAGCSSTPKQSQATENIQKPSSITRPASEQPKQNGDQATKSNRAQSASTGSPSSDNKTVPRQEQPKTQPHQAPRDHRVSGLPAESGASTADEDAKGSAAAGISAPTEQEQVTVLENELDGSLSDFDGKLLNEKELLDTHKRSARSQASAGEAHTTSGSHADDPRSVESSGNLTGAGMSAQDTTAKHGSPSRVPRRSGAASGMPDGKDDDIVARQLREAAEQETDPELKKKLWEEYRNYKLGSS